MPSNCKNYSTIVCEQKIGTNLCVQFRNQPKHALPITTTKRREVHFSIWLLLVVHHRFANATQAEHKFEDVNLINKDGEREKQIK